MKPLRYSLLALAFLALSLRCFALPNSTQTFNGYYVNSNPPGGTLPANLINASIPLSEAWSPDGYFILSNSLGRLQYADQYGAFVYGGSQKNETGYFDIRVTGGLGQFRLTAINIGEYTQTYSSHPSVFTNVYVEGYLGGVIQATSNSVSSANGVVTVQYAIDVSSFASKNIDTIRIHFTGASTGFTDTFNLVSFDVSAAAASPTVTSTAASSIGGTSAVLGGNVTNANGSTVTENGVVWSSTNSSPTIGGSGVTKTAISSGTGAFSGTVSSLSSNTKYYYTAYATSANGTGYGSTLNFTTSAAASSNANLSSLGLSSGTLSPSFAGGTTSYTASVSNATTSITATPTVADATATVKVNGNAVTSGSASGSINLSVGSNTITVLVTAQDASTKTYTVNVTRAASANADLSALSLSSGTLSPSFAGGTTSYTASVSNATTSITATPTVADATATVKVNGNAVTSGSASGSINLSVGSNTITVLVTAQDASTKTYTVTVTRVGSSNADLSALSLSSGTLSPTFAAGTTSYSASVSNATSSITVTPTVADATASVKVNGNAVTSGSASGSINLSVGSNTITVLVTAQDTTTTKTYTVAVTRMTTVASISKQTPASSPTNATSVVYRVVFGAAVSGVTTGNFDLNPALTVSSVSGVSAVGGSPATQWDVTVNTGTSDGTLTLRFASTTGLSIPVSTALPFSDQSYLIDKTVPSAPVSLALDSASDSGVSNSDKITKITTPTFTGTAEAGSTVKIYDGATLVGTGTATAGSFSIASSALSEGTHSITATATDAAGNTSLASSALSVTIYTTNPTITSLGTASGTYADAASYTITSNRTCAFGASSLPTGTSVDASTGVISGTLTQAGTFNATLTATDLAGNSNTKALTYTVAKAVITVTADDKTRAYGATNPSFTSQNSGFLNGDNASVITGTAVAASSAVGNTAVGDVAITVDVSGMSASNYSFTGVSGKLSITKAPLTVTADNKSRYYGYVDPSFSATITGFKNSETSAVLGGTAGFSNDATATSNVGTYTITVTQGSLSSGNYSFSSFVSGTLTVTKAPLTVTAANKSRPFGSDNPTLTADITGFKNGDTAAVITGAADLSTTAIKTSPVGDYTITAAIGNLSASNYAFTTFTDGILTVTKPVITVTADDKSRAYGTANPQLTYSYSGFVGTDTALTALTGAPTITTTATIASNANTYPITLGMGNLASTNYSFTLVNGTLTVSKVAVSVTAADKTRIYGQANPTFTYTMAGFIGSDTESNSVVGTPALTSAAIVSSDVGSYDITVDLSGVTSTNYALTGVKGSLTITKATPVVSWATPSSITYGTTLSGTQLNASADTAGSFTYTPVLGSILNAGSRNLGVSFTPTDTTNWISPVTQNVTLVVTKATPVVTWATPAAIAYGTALSATQLNAGATTAGVFTYTPASGAVLAVGSQTLGVSFAPTDVGNWNSPIAKNVSLTVDKATLTVKADDKSRSFGAANPALTYAITGFVNSENASALTGTPSLATAATTLSAVGSYAITVSAGTLSSQNYTFTFTSGNLVVAKASSGLSWSDPAPITYGTPLGSVQLSASASTSGDFAYSPTAGTILTAGKHTLNVDFAPNNSASYASSSTSVSITVNKAKQTITFGALSDAKSDAPPIALSAQASSGLPVVFGLVSGPASVSGNSVKLSGSAGTVVVRASQGGSENYEAAPSVDRSFSVVAAVEPPTIIEQPSDVSVALGSSASFRVRAEGTAPLTYQWSKDGSTISGATGATLSLGSIKASDVGSYSVVVRGPTATATSRSAALTLSLDKPLINSPLQASGAVGRSFLYRITTSAFAESFGATGLPTGLSVDTSSGHISGTPTQSGSFSVTLKATNSTGSDTKTLALTIQSALPVISSPAAANGRVGTSFSYAILASNSPTSYSADGLPAGLSVNATSGQITGTPTQSGSFTVTLSATNSAGTGTSVLKLFIEKAAAGPSYSGPDSLSARRGTAFSHAVIFDNGANRYDLTTLPDGSASRMPPGLSLSVTTGMISGTPTQDGSYRIAVLGTNDAGSAVAVITITVNAPADAPQITSQGSAQATVGKVFTLQLTASPAATSFAAEGLPSWLTLASATGVLSGTPTLAAVHNLTVTASNAAGTGPASALVVTVNPSSSAPVITSPATTLGRVGELFTYTLSADVQVSGYELASGTLPPGLNFVASGTITGTPEKVGVWHVWILAKNDAGKGQSMDLQLEILPKLTVPVITSNGSAVGQVGQAFLYVIMASGSPNAFTATGLPAGLGLNATTGSISGIPAASVKALEVTLGASNAQGSSDPKTLSLTIDPAPETPVVTSPNEATGRVGTAFSFSITATASPVSFLADGLPDGLVMNVSTGAITGTPLKAASYPVTVRASNAAGLGGTQTLTLTILPALVAPSITSAASATVTSGAAFSFKVVATPGPILSYNVSGALPTGLIFDSTTGAFSGITTEAGIYSLTLGASNAGGSSVPQSFVMTVAAAPQAPVIYSSTAATGTVGTAFNYQIEATAMPATRPYKPPFSLDASGLPTGLAVNPATGLIQGTPRTVGVSTVGLSGTNETGTGAVRTLTLTVQPDESAPVILSSSIVRIQVGASLFYSIQASGSPTSYEVLGAPSWMSIDNGSGVLAGIPKEPGEVVVSVLARNASGVSSPKSVTIAVEAKGSAPVITSSQTVFGRVGSTFSYQMTATATPTSFVLTGLPPGLVFDSSLGKVTGTPTSSGRFTATMTARNAAASSAPTPLVFVIQSRLTLTVR